MNKEDIRRVMVALEARQFACTRKAYLDYLAASRLEDDEATVIDEQAQAEFAAELSQSFDQPLHDHESKLAKLRSIDFSPKSQVAEGAVVRLLDRFFVVAVATDRFTYDTHELMGISVEAPIFQAMKGRSAGETFQLNGRLLRIDDVI